MGPKVKRSFLGTCSFRLWGIGNECICSRYDGMEQQIKPRCHIVEDLITELLFGQVGVVRVQNKHLMLNSDVCSAKLNAKVSFPFV